MNQITGTYSVRAYITHPVIIHKVGAARITAARITGAESPKVTGDCFITLVPAFRACCVDIVNITKACEASKMISNHPLLSASLKLGMLRILTTKEGDTLCFTLELNESDSAAIDEYLVTLRSKVAATAQFCPLSQETPSWDLRIKLLDLPQTRKLGALDGLIEDEGKETAPSFQLSHPSLFMKSGSVWNKLS